jgi:hypothetical protein
LQQIVIAVSINGDGNLQVGTVTLAAANVGNVLLEAENSTEAVVYCIIVAAGDAVHMAWAAAACRCPLRVVRGPAVMNFCTELEPSARLIAAAGIIILPMDMNVDTRTLEENCLPMILPSTSTLRSNRRKVDTSDQRKDQKM